MNSTKLSGQVIYLSNFRRNNSKSSLITMTPLGTIINLYKKLIYTAKLLANSRRKFYDYKF
ncbi:hypothetical protein Desor_1613 [Desulfosporosinus orientis DSM 765]|uniref:Uncharacterized protein n=1 Tax=Desulfosporosinus orientis (strain ATCC 19365 / DSM 765 / NCIMB 8382 / VKM B-1628 / Singapore I) TaxID=768706 RepID=G7WES9_DESOD|nr:hypothetical protein Desor_1613 [Desulfosporosinus orientis DSM 765]